MAAFTFMGAPQGRNPFGFSPQGLPDPAANQSIGTIYGTAYQQPGVFAGNIGNAYGTYGGALGGLGNAMTGAYGAFAGGLGNMASARAQERGADASARAMAEAARQGAAGNIAASALGNYGGAANSALAAWSANQAAYQKALSDMTASNQAGVSGFGQARSAALGNYGSNLAGAYGAFGPAMANLGSNLGAAAREDSQQSSQRSRDRGYSSNQSSSNASVNGDFGFGGGGGGIGGGNDFVAMGPAGEIASGSYGSGGGGGGMGMGGGGGVRGGKTSSSSGFQQNDQMASQDSASRSGPGAYFGSVADRAYGGMNSALAGLGNTQGNFYKNARGEDVLGALNGGYDKGLNSLNLQHYSSRDVPSQMLGQALLGMTALGSQGYDATNRGMDQFYSSLPGQTNYDSLLGGLVGGFGSTMGGLGGLQRDVGAGYSDTVGNMNDLWNRTMARTEPFRTARDVAEEQRALELYNRRNRLQDQLAQYEAAGSAGEPYKGFNSLARDGAARRLATVPRAGRI